MPPPWKGWRRDLGGAGQGFRRGRRSEERLRRTGDLGQDLLLKIFESSDGEVRRASLRVLGAAGLPPNAAPALRALRQYWPNRAKPTLWRAPTPSA